MPSKKTTAKVGAKGAIAMARHPTLRRATVKAGKTVAKRKAREQYDELSAIARTGAALWVIYGVPAARELGLIQPPKPRRTGRAFFAGVAIGAAAVYFLEPKHGAEHRASVANLLGSSA